MTHWIRELFRRPPAAAVMKSQRTRLGLHRLEDRDTPATFTVTSAADSGAGSLRDAVAQANATAGADAIVFQAGLGPVTLSSGQLSLNDTSGATTISGPAGGTQVVRRSVAVGTPLFRLFNVNSGVTASLNHLTITDGRSPSSSDNQGGGIRNVGNLTITNSVLSGNGGTVISNGGGIYNGGGGATLTVTGSTISGNGGLAGVAGNGGGISNSSGGTVTITSSTISGNVATFDTGSGGVGGGIFNSGIMTVTGSTISGNSALTQAGISNGGTLTVTNSTVSGNTANNTLGGSGNGGGIGNGGTLTLTGSTVSGNTARNQAGNASGGGLFSAGTLTVTNSTFSGNEAIVHTGGGVSIAGGTAALTNVTITANRSNNTGGGLSRSGGTATLNNTLIAGNFRGTGTTRDDVSGAVAGTSANNLVGDGTNLTGITNGTQGNLIGTAGSPINPLLQPLANNGGLSRTHALGQNSPALNKASASVANYSVYDQRGTARDLGAPDIGAYEVQHPLAPVGVPTTLALLYAPKPSATANEAFVKGLYQSTLLRAPDAGGQAHWLSQLAGGMTREQVANGFVNSTENRTNQVTFFYRYFLNREPDVGGLAHWVGRLQGGEDEGSVMTGFILSPEFSGSNNDTQFVNLMYYALLGREADAGGLNNWLNQLNTGTSRATVVNSFLRSEEGLNRVVRSLFQAYLKREADAGGLNTFRTLLNNGTTFGRVATIILGGQEFFNNATSNMT